MVPVKIVKDRQIVAKISFGVPDILEMPGWEQVYEEPLLSKFWLFFVILFTGSNNQFYNSESVHLTRIFFNQFFYSSFFYWDQNSIKIADIADFFYKKSLLKTP